MRKTRTEAINDVKSVFLPAERSAESAAAQGARCIAALIEARSGARLPLDTGAAALEQIVLATNMALQSRRHFFEAHRLLASLPAEIGVEMAYGPDDCPPNTAGVEDQAIMTLRAVA